MIGKRFAAHSLTMCGYRPRVRMPLLGYFAVMTPCLLGALFTVAEAFDVTPPRMDLVSPLRLPGSRVQVAVASSLPILTVREAPPPPMWALTSPEDQIMARQNEPIKRPVARIAGEPSKKPMRQARQQRSGTHYIASLTLTKLSGGFGRSVPCRSPRLSNRFPMSAWHKADTAAQPPDVRFRG